MFPILENLRGFFSSRPPLVVFMICLGSFAIALITFAYIVKARDIPNPDIKMDWNSFLDNFSNLEMCLPLNASDQEPFTNSSGDKIPLADLTPGDIYQTLHEMISKTINLPPINKREVPSSKKDQPTLSSTEKKSSVSSKLQSSTSASTQTVEDADSSYMNLTIRMTMSIRMKSESDGNIISGSTQYISVIAGRQINPQAGKLKDGKLAVTLLFPFNLSASPCEEWSGKTCLEHAVTTCVNFQGPAYLFPKTMSPPQSKECNAQHAALKENSPLRLMSPQVEGRRYNWCKKGIVIQPSFSFDDSLTVLLSFKDRSIINLHLMRTSYFLFVMVVTFFCYAMVKGRPAKTKIAHIPYVEKVPTHP